MITIVATSYVLLAVALPVSLVLGFGALVASQRGRRRVAWGLGLTALVLPLVGWLAQELWWAGIL